MKKFDHYCSNLSVLSRAEYEDLNNEFIIGGIIDKFNIQFELGWKVLKQLLLYEGRVEGQSGSPREILKVAYTIFDFIDEDIWLNMLKNRNTLTHIYDGTEAKRLVTLIIQDFIPAFIHLKEGILSRYPNIGEL